MALNIFSPKQTLLYILDHKIAQTFHHLFKSSSELDVNGQNVSLHIEIQPHFTAPFPDIYGTLKKDVNIKKK